MSIGRSSGPTRSSPWPRTSRVTERHRNRWRPSLSRPRRPRAGHVNLQLGRGVARDGPHDVAPAPADLVQKLLPTHVIVPGPAVHHDDSKIINGGIRWARKRLHHTPLVARTVPAPWPEQAATKARGRHPYRCDVSQFEHCDARMTLMKASGGNHCP